MPWIHFTQHLELHERAFWQLTETASSEDIQSSSQQSIWYLMTTEWETALQNQLTIV